MSNSQQTDLVPSGLEKLLENVPIDLYQPVQYLVFLQACGGFDALNLERVPSDIIGEIADKMGMSVATLNVRRSEWNRDNKMAKARALLQPYFNEQFALSVDMFQNAIPVLTRKLLEKALHKDASYGVLKDALLLAIKLTEPSKMRDKAASSEEDEAYIQGLTGYDGG